MKPIDAISAFVTVTVNGAPQSIESGATLAALIARMGHAPASIAVAVDAVFVPRDRRTAHALRGGEALTFFQPIVGG